MAPQLPHVDAWTLAVQVAAANGLRGLFVHELQSDPQVGSVTMEVHTDGAVDVTLCSVDGTPIGGYSL